MDPPFDQNSGSHPLPPKSAFCPLRPSNRFPLPLDFLVWGHFAEHSCTVGYLTVLISFESLLYALVGVFPTIPHQESPLCSDVGFLTAILCPAAQLPWLLFLLHPSALFFPISSFSLVYCFTFYLSLSYPLGYLCSGVPSATSKITHTWSQLP